MPIEGVLPKKSKNVKHGLIGELHRNTIAELYRELYYRPGIKPPGLRSRAYNQFKKKFPHVKCTLSEFTLFAKNQGISSIPPIDNEGNADRINELIEEYFLPRRKQSRVALIHSICKEEHRICTLDYVRQLYTDYEEIYGLEIIPDEDFHKEWKPEYNEVLLDLFFSYESCGADSSGKFLSKFCKQIGKAFNHSLIREKLLDIQDEPTINKVLNIYNIDIHLRNVVVQNIEDFMQRGLSNAEIVRKLEFFFQVEGYGTNVSDVQHLLNLIKHEIKSSKN